jgi:hypothetical protein
MKKTLPISIASAQYRHSNVSSYQGNPLILALPDRIAPERFITVMSRIIQVGINDVDMPDDDRIASLRNLRQMLIMTPQHLDLYNELYDLMCYGYVDRNPTRVEVIAWSYDIADSHIDIETIVRPLLDMVSTATTADAMFMTGISGNGKSLAVESILTNLFPTVIEHQTDSLNEPQITYIKVDMPHNANRSALIYQILTELDRALAHSRHGKTVYAQSVKKNSGKYLDIASMMEVLRTVLIRHHVGLLIIDEFQNLQVASQRYRDEMLQFFDELSNVLSIPNVKIGTPDTLLIFDKKGRHKRRIGATFELSRFTQQQDCDRMMKALFAYQPLKKPVEINDDMVALLFELSAGVPSILITLWESCLIEAIRSGKEALSLTLIKQTFKKRFPLMRMVTRNINQGKKGRHSDLLTVQQYLDSGNNTLAIKHLQSFMSSSELTSDTAHAVRNDIDNLITSNEFSEADLQKLAKIKAELDGKRESKRSPQTLEHDE